MDNEILCVRFILDANPVSVGDAVAKALVCGQPPKLRASEGPPTRRAPGGLPLPHPISSEWANATTNLPKQMNPEKVLQNGSYFVDRSISMGLRPLAGNDRIGAHPLLPGYRVSLESGLTSSLVTQELPTQAPGLSVKWAPRSFHTCLSSVIIGAAAAGVLLERCTPPAMGEGGDPDDSSWIDLTCQVRPLSRGKRTEVVRRLLDRGALVTVASNAADNAATLVLRMVCFMLEFETRAWLDCLGFGLTEVWRGARCAQDWAASGSLLTIGSYIFCVGHAAASPQEKQAGPLFDRKLARELSNELPKDPRCQGADLVETKFIEGNVDVESFAALLDRVCRRADDASDIFRRFVDLGSGHGLAVLTAHLLFPFRNCAGCELNPEAMASARELTRKYADSGLAASASSLADVKRLFVAGDFLQDLDWSDASVVFANSVCWPKDLIRSVGKRALRLHRGAVLLLAARQLPTEQDILEAFDVRGEAVLMSFSSEAVFIWAYQRR